MLLEISDSTDGRANWRLRRNELLLILASWSFVAFLSVATDLFDTRGSSGWSIHWRPVSRAFFEYFLWALLTPVVFWLSSRFSVDRAHRVWRVAILIAAGVVMALFVDLTVDLFRFMGVQSARHPPISISLLRSVTRLWFLNDLLVYFAVLAAGFAREYFLRYRTRQEEAVRLQAEAVQLQAQLTEARLAALRMQINPHFLFNTLHAISTLVERDPRGVRRMIARLSELLRRTLDSTNEQEVTLDEEVEFIQRYVEIMEIRFQGRLEIDMQIEPDVLDALVPNLILQPLVENAIQHGVSKSIGGGKIQVRARREGDNLVLRVIDNGPGLPTDESWQLQDEEGVGLPNTRARLQQLYGNAQHLDLRPADGGGLLVEVQLPFHTVEETVT
ncbi:MAG TPA: sensor histidine kinase [Longimicrobiaceae bacterium]|nr:sensor histidine kinase [Longimicrobiaceae bacterium]